MATFVEDSARVRLAIVPLGGTILGARSRDGGYVPTLAADTITSSLAGLEDVSFITVESVNTPSAGLRIEDVVVACAAARELVLEGATGVVILCGTDTLEEVAFAVDTLWDLPAPVVVTGALRPPDAAGADGQANFAAAVAVASSTASVGRGCLVVLNGEIHAARYVQKRHPSSLAAFVSSPVGPIGMIVEDQVRFVGWTARHPVVPFRPGDSPAPVALLTFALGDDAQLIDAVEPAGYRGLVIEGSGGGSVSARWAESLGRLALRMPVVYASRTGTGPVLSATYGGSGGEIDLVRRGIRPAGMLDGLKARVLLSLLIGAGNEEILTGFARRAEVVNHEMEEAVDISLSRG